jgi:hypothetical protein
VRVIHLSDLPGEALGAQLFRLYAFDTDHTSGGDRRRSGEN